MSGTLKNYYEILGVPRSANTDQIRVAYRKLLLKFHPDKNVGDSYFEDWSKKIIEAFEVLNDPQIRAEYDKVYDEAKMAWRRAAAAGRRGQAPYEDVVVKPREEKEAAFETDQTPNGVPGHDEAIFEETAWDAVKETGENDIAIEKIEALAPGYVAAKKADIEARNKLKAIKTNTAPITSSQRNLLPMAVCAGVMLLVLGWFIFSRFGGAEDDAELKPAEVAENKIAEKQAAPAIVTNNNAIAPQPETITGPVNFEPIDQEFRAIAAKVYFYESPGGRATPNFLSKGNKFKAIKKYQSYYYGTFQALSNADYKMEGWVNAGEVESVP